MNKLIAILITFLVGLVFIGMVEAQFPPGTYSEYNPTPYGGFVIEPYHGNIYYGSQYNSYYNVYDTYGQYYGSAGYSPQRNIWGTNYGGIHNYGYSDTNIYADYLWG